MRDDFQLSVSTTYMLVFIGGSYIKFTTPGDLTTLATLNPSPGPQSTRSTSTTNLTEYLTSRGIQVKHDNIAYLKDINNDPSVYPNPIFHAVANMTPFPVEFTLTGILGTGTAKGAIAVIPIAGTVIAVCMHRGTAGSSSSTIVDINKNGTTMYTTQGNRPTMAYNDGDNIVLATLPDVTSVAIGDTISMDIDQVEGGSPAALRVSVWIRPLIN